jgi:cytoskeletal protein RodZ
MRILYVIFVMCVGALVWAALAAARHIRRHEGKTDRLSASSSQKDETNGNDRDISSHSEKAHHD